MNSSNTGAAITDSACADWVEESLDEIKVPSHEDVRFTVSAGKEVQARVREKWKKKTSGEKQSICTGRRGSFVATQD